MATLPVQACGAVPDSNLPSQQPTSKPLSSLAFI
jgi:hypothetical protein